jgi:hypothetical protein
LLEQPLVKVRLRKNGSIVHFSRQFVEVGIVKEVTAVNAVRRYEHAPYLDGFAVVPKSRLGEPLRLSTRLGAFSPSLAIGIVQ